MKYTDFDKIEYEAVKICGRDNFINERAYFIEQLSKSSKLKEVRTDLLLKEFMYGISLGFTFNPSFDYCNILPKKVYKDRKHVGTIAEFRPTYKGVAWAAQHWGVVNQIYANVVYEGDEFEVIMGTSQEIVHKPKFKTKEITHAYAIANVPGGKQYIEILSKEDIEAIKTCSDGLKYDKDGSTPWKKFEGQMCRKSAILRLCNYIPKNKNFQKVVEAEQKEYLIDPYGSKASFIRSLINTSSYEDDYKSILEDKINEMSYFEADNIINDLKENQVDRASNAILGNSQGDINKALDKVLKNDRK